MFVSRQRINNILTLLLFLILYTKCGTKAEENFLSDPTFEPDILVPFRLQTFTTEESSTFNRKDALYQESENLNEIGSKSNMEQKSHAHQELNINAAYKDDDDVFDGRNQLHDHQKKQKTSSSSSQYQKEYSGPVEYVTVNHTDSSRKRAINHRMAAFEKHKAHHRNYRRYGHKSYGHKRNYSKYKKFVREHSRAKQKFNGSNNNNNNEQSPYYQGQLSYYSELDGVDNLFDYPPLSEKVRNHRYHHLHHYPHHHHNHHQHSNNHHNRRIDEYNENSKWPHLSRVQYQLYEDEKEDYLPPYIKKYKKRNKQLLDLLEGTMPPPSILKSTESSVSLRKRKKSQHHYHNHRNPKWIVEDLFEEQKANPNNPNIDDDQYVNDAQSISAIDSSLSSLPTSSTTATTASSTTITATHSPGDIEDEELKSIRQNELPGDDISLSSDEEDNKSSEEGSTSSSSSNNNNNSSNRRNSNNNRITADDKQKSLEQSLHVISTEQEKKQQRPELLQSRVNKFIYHRVDTAPRVVGAGNINGSKKQRLPFVAITDRRLETSKTRQKDFEQNHLPMP